MLGKQSLARWYGGTDQEFLRREVEHTRRWLLRGSGATWLAGYAALLVMQSLLVVNVQPGTTGYGSLGGALLTSLRYGWIFSVPAWFAVTGWAVALHTRTFAPLAGERGGELFLTHLEGRQLWPALLIAPMALRVAMAVVASMAGVATFTYWLFTVGPPLREPAPVVWLMFRGYSAVLGLALFTMQQAAATAWAAWWIHPGGGALRTGLRAVLVAMGCYALDTILVYLSQAVMFGGGTRLFLSPMLRDPRLLLPYHHAFFPGVLVRFAVFGWLGWIALRKLRSAESMEAWGRALEK
jgi:hypothetical protein